MSSRCETRVRPAADLRGTAAVLISGDIDGDAKSVLPAAYTEAVATHDPAIVLLDFTDVDYINSTGIAVIVGVLARARADGRKVSASGLTDHYKHIFTVTRLVDFITLVDPVDSTNA